MANPFPWDFSGSNGGMKLQYYMMENSLPRVVANHQLQRSILWNCGGWHPYDISMISQVRVCCCQGYRGCPHFPSLQKHLPRRLVTTAPSLFRASAMWWLPFLSNWPSLVSHLFGPVLVAQQETSITFFQTWLWHTGMNLAHCKAILCFAIPHVFHWIHIGAMQV